MRDIRPILNTNAILFNLWKQHCQLSMEERDGSCSTYISQRLSNTNVPQWVWMLYHCLDFGEEFRCAFNYLIRFIHYLAYLQLPETDSHSNES